MKEYFKNNNISSNGGWKMALKSVIMFSLFFIPQIIVCFSGISNPLMLFVLFILSGLGMAGIGMGVMHDAIHGSYSKNKFLNRILGYSVNLVGGNHTVWRLQHNVLHHSYTNIHDHDDDINAPLFLRFSPNAPKNKLHKFQHFYAWFFYCLTTISWITTKDFIHVHKYYKMGILGSKKKYLESLTGVFFWKVTYYTLALAFPLIFSSYSAGMIVMAFLVMHFVTGFFIAIIFQLAHVVPETAFPTAPEDGKMESNRLVHQLETTSNFAPKNSFLFWFVGGLTNQIEHHLFPNICHIHYKKIAPIVRQTAQEFGVPYYENRSFGVAIHGHYKMLRQLGR